MLCVHTEHSWLKEPLHTHHMTEGLPELGQWGPLGMGCGRGYWLADTAM